MKLERRFPWRLFGVFLALALLFIVPFLFFGAAFERALAGPGAVEWLRAHGGWAWAVGLALLVLDLVLPVPATAVMAALGYLYGPIAGGALSALGSTLAGLTAYALCRAFGRPAAARLAGEEELERAEELFGRAGGWLVAVSRWLPLLPEVITCMAGLARMPLRVFVPALLAGSLPLGFSFAAVGSFGEDRPVLALVLSAVLPLGIWPLAHALLLRRAEAKAPDPAGGYRDRSGGRSGGEKRPARKIP